MSKRELRRPPRIQTSVTATLVDSDGGKLSVKILDLSSGGFRVRADESLVVGERVQLHVSRYGAFSAEVLWVEGFEAGGRFLEPVTL